MGRSIGVTFLLGLLVAFPATAQEDLESLIQPRPIAQVRDTAREGEFVTIEGFVARADFSEGLFVLEDDSGRMAVKIPEYVTRDTGVPGRNETIRVSGEYDHKTFVGVRDVAPTTDGSEWGIRVRQLERNLEGSGRNSQSNPPDATVEVTPADEAKAAVPAPAAPARVIQPELGDALKQRMSAARQRTLGAKQQLEDAEAAYARALYEKRGDAELSALHATVEHAEAELADAQAAITPLGAEARAQGLDEKMIELYESGIIN